MQPGQWIDLLAAKIRPRSPAGAANRMANLLPELQHLPAWVFCEASVSYVAGQCSQTPGLARLIKLLDEFRSRHQAEHAPAYASPPISQQERDASAWEDRKAWLRQDWDDPAGIAQKVRNCRGNVLMLRLLAKLVRMWAPQHLGFLPPRILEAIETDSEIAPSDLHLRYADDDPPEGTRSVAEQLAALNADARPEPRPRHLTPEQLDRINPLPNGRKRTDDRTPSAAPIVPDASTSTADEDATASD